MPGFPTVGEGARPNSALLEPFHDSFVQNGAVGDVYGEIDVRAVAGFLLNVLVMLEDPLGAGTSSRRLQGCVSGGVRSAHATVAAKQGMSASGKRPRGMMAMVGARATLCCI